MALNLKLPKLFGAHHAVAATADLDMPTTQVRAAQPGYDPLASVSIMEQLRSATSEMKLPRRLPWIGHLPIVQQFQVLGVLMVTFLVFAAFMVFLDGRTASQGAAAASTATEMQMLSQRLARGTALASQGQAAAFPALKDSRERFKADLEALQGGGTVKGVSLDVSQDETVVKLLGDIRARWDRLDVNAGRVIDNQQSLTTLAKGLDNINQGNNAILELAQQAAQQVGQGGSRRTRTRWPRGRKSTPRSRSCWARTPARSATS
jgi:twitching motility protein PilJ